MGRHDGNGLSGKDLVGLRWVDNPRDPYWELHWDSSRGSRAGLLGWMVRAAPVDAGVPAEVARVITRALCRIAKLAFLHSLPAWETTSPTWQPLERGWACALNPGWLARLQGKPVFSLFCTADAESAQRLFYDVKFSWELRSQVVLLAPVQASAPPVMAYRQGWELWTKRADQDLQSLAGDLRVDGFMFPGVDGDFVQFVITNDGLWDKLQRELMDECALAGIDWSKVGEAEFKNTRWFTPR